MEWTSIETASENAPAPAVTTAEPRRRVSRGRTTPRTKTSAKAAPTVPVGPGDDRRTFDDFAATIREELTPAGPIEAILADLVARSAWALREAGVGSEPTARPRARPAATGREGKAMIRALAALDRFRAARRPGWGAIRALGMAATPSLGDQPRILDEGRWRDRLTFDPEVSDTSPIIKGTWVTAGQVVALIVDGWSWADILRAHPELSEDDIRACLSYTVEAEG